MATPNTDTTKMYRVNFAFIVQNSVKRRSGTIMIRAADMAAATKLAQENLKNEAFDWFKISAILPEN